MPVHRGKTSIYLSDERVEAINASGLTLLQVLDAGINAVSPQPKRSRVKRTDPADCTHPLQRRDPKNKNLCRACGTPVG